MGKPLLARRAAVIAFTVVMPVVVAVRLVSVLASCPETAMFVQASLDGTGTKLVARGLPTPRARLLERTLMVLGVPPLSYVPALTVVGGVPHGRLKGCSRILLFSCFRFPPFCYFCL